MRNKNQIEYSVELNSPASFWTLVETLKNNKVQVLNLSFYTRDMFMFNYSPPKSIILDFFFEDKTQYRVLNKNKNFSNELDTAIKLCQNSAWIPIFEALKNKSKIIY